VTGLHRTGTGWVSQMLAATSEPSLAYLWEPFSKVHRPGICAASFPFWYPYITAENGYRFATPISDMLEFRYRAGAELRSVRSAKDLGRLARDGMRFRRFRRERAVPLLKDPIALFSAPWLTDTFDVDVLLLVRHPAAFAHSLQRRNLAHPFEDFLRQPSLMDDLLSAYEPEIRRFAVDPQPIVDQAILLWNLAHATIDRFRTERPGWAFARLEDLARDPLGGYGSLYARFGLSFDEQARSTILAHTDSSNPVQVENPSSVRRNSIESVVAWKSALGATEIARIRSGVEDVSSRFYDDEDW
jgi:hypothetical protein